MAYMDLDTGARERTPRTTAYAPPPQTVEPPAPTQPAPRETVYQQPPSPYPTAIQPSAGEQHWGNYNPYYQGGANPYGSGGYTPMPPEYSSTPGGYSLTGQYRPPGSYQLPPTPATSAQPAGGAQNWGNYNPYYQGGANPYGSGGYTGPYQGPNYASQQLQSGMYGAAPGTAGYQLPPTPATSAPPGGGTNPQGPPPSASAPYQMGQNFQYGGTTSGTPYSQVGQYRGQLEGFDSGKLDDPTHTSAKYMFARVASRYAPTPQGFAQLMADPDFQQLGMQSMGNGRIRLSNGDIIDVVRGFQSGGQAWQWGAETVNGQAPAPGTPGTPQTQAPPQQQPVQAAANAWQQYYQALADWQARYGQQGQPQRYGETPAAPLNPQQAPTQVWEAPSVPEGATAYPQGGYQQDYPGYAYNPGYTPLAGGYMPQAAWYPGPGSYDPTAQAFSYLGQGMFPGAGY